MTACFSTWWHKLETLAAKERWPLGDPESYREYFDDGNTPEETLEQEIDYADEYDTWPTPVRERTIEH